jgi:hypothetical protein
VRHTPVAEEAEGHFTNCAGRRNLDVGPQLRGPLPRRWPVTATITTFEARVAPCGKQCGGEQFVSEDMHGLVTEDLRFECGCQSHREEFHDGSVHHMVENHHGRVLVDEEFRGE